MSEAPVQDDDDPSRTQGRYSSERAKAFVDAVVAIALTLLILPLLESLTRLADRKSGPGNAAEWFSANQQLLLSFLISFVVIAMFWVGHHRMYAQVHHVTPLLLWLNMAWLLTIVWLPVATAMTSVLDDSDPLVKVVYIGTMTVTSLLAFAQAIFLRAHGALHAIPAPAVLRSIAVALATSVLFALSLVVALLVPSIGYFALFLLWLTGPVASLIARLLGAPAGTKRRAAR